MISLPCRLSFLALMLVAGFFNSSFAQDTVPKETVPALGCRLLYSSSGAYSVASLDQCVADKLASVEDNCNINPYEGCTFDGNVAEVGSGYTDYYLTRTARSPFPTDQSYSRFRVFDSYGTIEKCPSSHPIDNGDGTCSLDQAHNDFCEKAKSEYWSLSQNEYTPPDMPLHLCFTPSSRNPENYSCAYRSSGAPIDGAPRYWFATGETCAGENYSEIGEINGNEPDPIEPQDPLVPDAPVSGVDLGGEDVGSPPPDAAEGDFNILADKIDFSLRNQTKNMLDGTAIALNKENENRDKNSKYIVEALGRHSLNNDARFRELTGAVRASNVGSGNDNSDLLGEIAENTGEVSDGFFGDNGVFSGGVLCETEAECAALYETIEPNTGDDLVNEYGQDHGIDLENIIEETTEELTFDTSQFGFSVNATCPEPITFQVAGETFEIPLTAFCDLANILRAFILAAAWLWAGNHVIRAINGS